jgi:arylsulfatase A-like enzyme
MTNQAINWVKAQQSMTPDKPFFVYFATGAVHAPHHVPKAWADKYEGKFDKGWDQTRQETTESQKTMGIIPADTKLAPRPEDIKAWDALPAEHRKLFSRQAEVFAGFMEQTDHEVGRFVNAIEDIGEMDNTLFIYVAGDNGTSAEGEKERPIFSWQILASPASRGAGGLDRRSTRRRVPIASALDGNSFDMHHRSKVGVPRHVCEQRTASRQPPVKWRVPNAVGRQKHTQRPLQVHRDTLDAE